ncbi:MAG: hypothetical protein Q7V57_16315 [Actinomycetota bacterium]|nr:hypothetical protein [Actinomycetota bacterium]
MRAARVPSRVRRAVARLVPTSATRRALLLLGATVFFASAALQSTTSGWNVTTRLDLVLAIVDHGEVTIDRYHDTPPYDTNDKAFYDGHFYSDKTIGLTMLAVPVYAAARVVAAVAGHTLSAADTLWVLSRGAVSTTAALAAMLLAALLIRLGAVPRKAVLATAGMFFGSMLFGYSTVFMPYLPGIAACLGALLILLSPPLTAWRAAAIGGLLGFALILDLMFVFAVAAIVVLLLARLRPLGWRRGSRLAVATGGAALVPIGILVGYCIAIFGSPSIPYKYEYDDFFREEMAKGVMGATMPKPNVMWFLSFHPYRGLLFWSPWIAMIIVCSVWILRRDRRLRPLAIAAIVVFGAYFVFNSGYYLWWGGAAMGPRLMLPMFGVVPLVLAVACRADSPRWMWRALVATLVIGVALSLPVSMVEPGTAEGNTIAQLLDPPVGAHLSVPQLDRLGSFYSLQWSQIVPSGVGKAAGHWLLCLAIVFAGTWLAHRTARRGERAEPV